MYAAAILKMGKFAEAMFYEIKPDRDLLEISCLYHKVNYCDGISHISAPLGSLSHRVHVHTATSPSGIKHHHQASVFFYV